MRSVTPLLVLSALALVGAGCADNSPPPVVPTTASVEAAAGSVPNASATPSGPRHAFTVDDMLSFDRISDATVSPDGKLVTFTVSTPDVEANKSSKDVWIAATDGSGARRLTSHPEADSDARFAPDGKTVYFLSSRSGSSQVWRIAVDGGEATQVTHVPVDVGAVLPFPDGKRLLLAMDVYPDAASLEDSAKREQAASASKQHVRAYDQLPVREWDTWDEGRRSHLFVVREGSDGAVDLMKGLPYDAPTKPFGARRRGRPTSISGSPPPTARLRHTR
jgi:dipeptidyl aminopeptidase/acylaminoacyl peptidase